MLTSRCFNIDWWSPQLQIIIHYLLCCFINMDERMLWSQIACHTFICLSQTRPLWKWPMETRDMHKELGLCYVAFLTIGLYIQLYQFIIVQVNLPTLYHQVTSSFILVLKVYIWTSWTLWLYWPSRLFLDITIPDSQQSWLSSTQNCQYQSSQRLESCCPNCLWTLKTNSLSTFSSAFWSYLYHQTKTNGKKRPDGRSPIKSPWIWISLPYLSPDQGN